MTKIRFGKDVDSLGDWHEAKDVQIGIDMGSPDGDKTVMTTRHPDGTIEIHDEVAFVDPDIFKDIQPIHLCGNSDWKCHCFDPPRKKVDADVSFPKGLPDGKS